MYCFFDHKYRQNLFFIFCIEKSPATAEFSAKCFDTEQHAWTSIDSSFFIVTRRYFFSEIELKILYM